MTDGSKSYRAANFFLFQVLVVDSSWKTKSNSLNYKKYIEMILFKIKFYF